MGLPACCGVRQDKESLSRQRCSFREPALCVSLEGSAVTEALRPAAQFICLCVCSLGPCSSGRCSLLEEVPRPSPHHFSLLSHLNSLSCIISISFLMKELWDQSRISHLPELKLSYDRFLFPSLSSLSGSHLAPTLVLPTQVLMRTSERFPVWKNSCQRAGAYG